MLDGKRKQKKPMNTAGQHQLIAEDQVNGGTTWRKEFDHKFRLKDINGKPHKHREIGKARKRGCRGRGRLKSPMK